MKKPTLFQRLKAAFKAETPVFARFFQTLSVGVAALPLYYSGLDPEIKAVIPKDYLLTIAVVGGILIVICQFFEKKGGAK